MALRKVRVAFIGCGNFVSGNHLPNVHRNPGFHVRALCDINREALDGHREAYAPDYVTCDYREVLSDREVEAVIIGVHGERWPFLRDAIAAGKDVFVEKPMSMTREETDMILDLMKNHPGRRLMVGFNRRFAPIMRDVKRLFDRQPRPAMILYRIVDDATLWPAYPFDLGVGGGKLVVEVVHIFDLLRWLTGSEPVRVYAEGWEADNDIVTLRFEDDTIATIVSGGLGSKTYPKELLEIFANSTTIVADNFLELKVNGIPGEADKTYPMRQDHYADRVPGTGVWALREKLRLWREEITPEEFARKAYYSSLPSVHKGHYEEMDAFADAVRNDKASPCSEVDGARATILALKARESIRSGVPVAVGGYEA